MEEGAGAARGIRGIDSQPLTVRTVPCFFNDSYLLVEIDELDQLLLQDLLPAHDLLDEDMLQQVEHVRSQLEILNQTSVGARGGGEEECKEFLGFTFKV